MDDIRNFPLRRLRHPGMFNAWLSYCGLTPLFYASWRKAACLARSHLPQGAKILDYGCGAGGLTRCLIAQHFRCTAVEWNAWLLRETGKHLARHKDWGEWVDEDKAELMLADHATLPLPDNSFELAVNFLSLHGRSGEERERMLAEMRRLAPRAMLMDWQMPERNLDIPAAAFSAGLVRMIYGLTGLSTRKKNGGCVRDYFRAGAFEGVLYGLRDECRLIARDSCLGGSLGLALVEWK